MIDRRPLTRATAREEGLLRPRPFAPRPPAGRANGFTLVELLVVMVIISILLGFILNAAMDSLKRAQERATQTLITKLETGLNDRLSALLQTRPLPNSAHTLMATTQNLSGTVKNPILGAALVAPQRAQVIAWYDYIKRYMPDTFYVQNANPTSAKGIYPINFAGSPYPLSGGTATDVSGKNLGLNILPMGNSVAPPYGDGSGGSGYNLTKTTGLMEYNPTGDGIFGASYTAAAGIYKNLGYQPTGYDGIDNNGDGTVDDALEGINASNLSEVVAHLGNHTHVTARAEMLYALLVEGQGPLGSVFNADDFTDKEVQDTDQDGLPEFVDAWGKPLQFFRWPMLYHSDVQRGQVITVNGGGSWTLQPPYYDPVNPTSTTSGMFMQREQDPLDLNQQLMAPLWWSNSYNNTGNFSIYNSLADNTLGLSGPALAFEFYFHRLCEPMTGGGGTNYWDRGSPYGNRRAFYTKFLILSAGLDGQYGVFLYPDTGTNALSSTSNPAWALIANENNAMPFSVADIDFTSTANYGSTTINYSESTDPTNPTTGDLMLFAQDDISNQNIQTTVGIGGGG